MVFSFFYFLDCWKGKKEEEKKLPDHRLIVMVMMFSNAHGKMSAFHREVHHPITKTKLSKDNSTFRTMEP